MKIDHHIDAGQKAILFKVTGELDVHQAKVLRAAVQEVLRGEEEGAWSYEFDLGGVAYLDSSGLGMLVYLQKEITRRKGTMSLTQVQEAVAKVFEITKLDGFFTLRRQGQG